MSGSRVTDLIKILKTSVTGGNFRRHTTAGRRFAIYLPSQKVFVKYFGGGQRKPARYFRVFRFPDAPLSGWRSELY